VQHAPKAYQLTNGAHRTVACRYVILAQNEVEFSVGAYDHRRPLVIDPALSYSSFLGGSGEDDGSAIAVDSTGHTYVAGYTYSADFPTTSGVVDRKLQSPRNAFVTKFNPAGTKLMYSTYVGDNLEIGSGIAVDSSGNAYIVGSTNSLDFGTQLGPPGSNTGGGQVFVAKLNSTGSTYLWAVRFGGIDPNGYGSGAIAVAVDSTGHAYVTGQTDSPQFPVTAGAYQTNFICSPNSKFPGCAFVSKLNTAATGFVYSTYFASEAAGNSIEVDGSGYAYIVGHTLANIPTTPGVVQATRPCAFSCGFATKFNSTGSALVYSTYLGGSDQASSSGIKIDSAGNAYVTGWTTTGDYPTTPGAFQRTFGGGQDDSYISKLNPTATAFLYSTLLGGSGFDESWAITIDSSGHVYVAGATDSANFPVTMNAFQRVLKSTGPGNAFVTELKTSGSGLVASSFLGGGGMQYTGDKAFGIALDSKNSVYVAGTTASTDFPVTPGAAQGTFHGGSSDAFVAKIIPLCAPSLVNPSVTICSPPNNGMVHSPVAIRAGTTDTHPVTSLKVLIDGVQKYQAALSAIAITLPMSKGGHQITVQGKDIKGTKFQSQVSVTVH
jgi:hypothetical protein